MIVHKQNPVKNLTLEQLRAVFTGKIRNWQEQGDENKKINLIIREEGSGTQGCFEEIVMPAAPFARDALVQDSNGAVREIVAGDPAAIGYISFGLVDERVKPLSIDGIAPSESTITSHTYPIARRFLFLTNGEPGELARSFLEFVLSPKGQKTLVDEGLIKATLHDKTRNPKFECLLWVVPGGPRCLYYLSRLRHHRNYRSLGLWEINSFTEFQTDERTD